MLLNILLGFHFNKFCQQVAELAVTGKVQNLKLI